MVVRTGVEAALRQAHGPASEQLGGVLEALPPVNDDPAVALDRAMALANRIVRYLT